jgi:hypothetical protein
MQQAIAHVRSFVLKRTGVNGANYLVRVFRPQNANWLF